MSEYVANEVGNWIGFAAGLATFAFLMWIAFDDFFDFLKAVGYLFKPDLLSLFDGTILRDWWETAKIGFAVAVAIGVGVGTSNLAQKFLIGDAPSPTGRIESEAAQ